MHTHGGTVSVEGFGFHHSADSLSLFSPDPFPLIALG